MGSIFGVLKGNFPIVVVLVTVVMLLIPLPTFILDAFMALNLMFALLILLIVLTTEKPTDFGLFPSMLLVSTVTSLALNVSSTRLILTMGSRFDGRMIRAFSSFVVGSSGNEGLVVGFIIFVVIIAVQAFVITKGAGRVSEVAARFTLDGMNVKMMTVETEYSNGAITEEEANLKRGQIQKESDFYGSMDGASKFVSGNVKVGIFITIINIVGGLIVGMAMYGESMSVAVSNYISLSIGDGLLSQFPSLLISVAMGMVVTRASEKGEFSGQLIDQLFNRKPSIYWILSGVLLFIALLPGFPWYVLVPMSAIVAFHAFNRGRQLKQATSNDEMMRKTMKTESAKPADIPAVVPLDPLSLELGYALVPLVEKEKGAELLDRIHGVRRQSAFDLGLVIPKVRIIDNSILDPYEYCFKIKGVDAGRGKIRIGYFLCLSPGSVTTEIEGEKTVDPAFGLPAIWVTQERRDEAERAGYTVVDPPSIIATHLTEIIRRRAADILTLQDTQAILDTLRKENPAVVDEIFSAREGKNSLRITEIQKILHALLNEKVSIRNIVTILEAVAEYMPVSRKVWFLAEKVRQALSSQICQQYTDDDRKLRILTIDPALEHKIIDSKFETPTGIISTLDPQTSNGWIIALTKAVTAAKNNGWIPVICCSEPARPIVKHSISRELPDLAVLSVPEIDRSVVPVVIGTIRIDNNTNATEK